jgi:predicted MFS family arabinose efflux permease
LEPAQRLFTPRFFLMCGFSFTVFLSAFQLLPVAPYRILALGGTAAVAGLFLGFLTYSSAFSAPLTGTLVDRLGPRRVLIAASLAITLFSLVYAVLPSYPLMLTLVVVHGLFWSGLLSASAAYVVSLIPVSRRAEGMGYWGLSTVLAVSVAPTIGLWVYGSGGWTLMCLEAAALNLVMAAIAHAMPREARQPATAHPVTVRTLLEWRVLVVSFALFLYAFGYGGVTSFVALYADANGVTPRALFFTLFCLTTIGTRPFIARLADRVGYRRVFLPCVGLVVLSFALLALSGSRAVVVPSAMLFGAGFGSAYPAFLGHVLRFVDERRRGAAFGSIIGMFDTGIGTGSITMGWMIEGMGYRAAWTIAAALAACAIPYFLLVERKVLVTTDGLPQSG